MEKSQNDQLSKSELTEKKPVMLVPNREALTKLEDYKEEFSLNAKYKGAEEWPALKEKPLRAYFMGFKEIPDDKGEVLNAAVFVSATEVFLCAQTVLVDAVRNLDAQTPVEIIYKGKKDNKSSVGSTMIFDVKKLG